MARLTWLECGIPSRRQFLRLCAAAGSLAATSFLGENASTFAQVRVTLTWGQVTDLVLRQLASRRGYQSGDLLSQGEVRPVFDVLAQAGWVVADRDEIIRLVLEDGHYLVKQSRTSVGLKFLRGVAKQSMVYDRLDRLCAMPGGQQLVHDMMRLPNGQDLMKPKPTPGFTDLTSLLPKQANGKSPRNKDFDKPTGKIYTEAQLVKALEKSWKTAKG